MGTEDSVPASHLPKCRLESSPRLYLPRPQSTRAPCPPPHPPAWSPAASKSSSPPTRLPMLGSPDSSQGQFGSPMSSSLGTEPGTPTTTRGTWTSMLWLLLKVFSDPQYVPHSNHKPPWALDRAKETSLQGVRWVWLGHRQTWVRILAVRVGFEQGTYPCRASVPCSNWWKGWLPVCGLNKITLALKTQTADGWRLCHQQELLRGPSGGLGLA